MGGSSSKNKSILTTFNETINETINESMTQVAQTSVSTITPTQLIKIHVMASGDVNISELNQKIVANIDTEKFISNVSETQLKSIMASALEVAAKDNQEVENGLVIGASIAENVSTAEVRNKNVNRIVNSYSYSQFISDVQTIMAAQTIDISGIAGKDFNIAKVSQFIKAEMISKQISDQMTKVFQEIQTEAETKVKKETDQSASAGFSLGWGMIIFIVILFVLIGGGVAWYFWGGGKELIADMMNEGNVPNLSTM